MQENIAGANNTFAAWGPWIQHWGVSFHVALSYLCLGPPFTSTLTQKSYANVCLNLSYF